MAQRDYYEILSVSRKATTDEIKKAYRKLARKYHPDVCKEKDAEKKFKEVNEAYEVLSDTNKRAAYDQFGHAGVGMGGGPGAGAGGRGGPFGGAYGGPGGKTYTWSNNGGQGMPDLEDIFGDLFGGGGGPFGRSRGRRRPEPMAGQDTEHHVNLAFEEAVWGTKLRIQLQRPNENGRMESETIEIKIPAGVAEGSKIRVRGKGQPGMNGGPMGDLYIVTHVKPHLYFRREENDIYIDLPITVTEAIRGAKVTIPTIDGPTVVSVPPGTSSGQKLRLKGKGVPIAGSSEKRGDQYAVIKIVVPKEHPAKMDTMLDELQTISGDPRKAMGWTV
jgi:curved DNA-binding protein